MLELSRLVGDRLSTDSDVVRVFNWSERIRSFRLKETATTKIINDATNAKTTVRVTRTE